MILSEERTKTRILEHLKLRGQLHSKAIAVDLDMSPITASKYLRILEAEGKVQRVNMKPYVFWRLSKG